MNNYNISPALNKNKVFILHKSELEKRFDPSWYVYLKSIKYFKHKKIAFKNLLLENPQYGANEIGIERTDNSEPRYVRITDINEFGELINELGKTASVIEEKYFLKENDLLLARSGNTVGKSYLHKDLGYNCFFAGYMIRFKVDALKVLPEYVFAYTQTDFYKRWTKAIQRTTGQPNINAEEYKSLEIPLPNIEIQGKIVKIYFDFLAQKQQNEAAAEKLLASIDDYLLEELGITLPASPENNLKSRMYTTMIKGISGNRFDPFYHQKIFDSYKNPLSKYPTKKIKEISEEIKTGLPVRKDFRVDGGAYPYYGANGIIGFMDEFTHDGLYLVIGQDGYIGKHYVVEGKFWGSNHNWVLKLKAGYDYHFIKSILDVLNYDYLITGGVIPKLTKESLESIRVPVPLFDKQKEIADHITGIRQQAQQLQEKTKEELSKASQEIEKILLA